MEEVDLEAVVDKEEVVVEEVVVVLVDSEVLEVVVM